MINIQSDLDTNLDKVKELIKGLEDINNKATLIQFIGIKEFSKLSGWSIKTVQNLYNRKDFPSTDYGKEKKAEVHAIINYFKVPRRK